MFRPAVLVLVLAAVAACVAASPLDSPPARLLQRVYAECAAKEGGVAPCLKARAVAFLDKVSRMDSVPLAEGLSVVRAPEAAERQPKALSQSELENASDADLSDMVVQRVSSFFNGRTLQLQLPSVSQQDVQRSLEEGRGKMKKMMGMMMMMGGMMKFGLLMLLKIKGLFFLAKKALIISKIALFLALAVVIKKLLSSQDSHSSGWSSGGHGGGHSGGWDRSWDAHNVAYKAHRP